MLKLKLLKDTICSWSTAAFNSSAGPVAKPAFECNDTQIHRYCRVTWNGKKKQEGGKKVIKLITNILNKLKA